MQNVIYGVWNGQVFDRRHGLTGLDLSDRLLDEIRAFCPDNPTTGFVAPQGFLVFSEDASLSDLLWRYYARARELCCGRCTPCRAGTLLIERALFAARAGRGAAVDWDRARQAGEMMKETSLCGIGETTPAAFLGALEHFREDLLASAPLGLKSPGFYAVATAPCIEACPAHVNIPRYIDLIRDGHPERATGVLLQNYPLVGSCGRVCARPCEKACLRRKIDGPVSIRDLKRHASDFAGGALRRFFPTHSALSRLPGSDRVAVIGAGPSGIACAYHLLLRGVAVDIFDKAEAAGGMARVGIPSYRLPNDHLDEEAALLEDLGGHYLFGRRMGRDFAVDDLFNAGYRAVYLAIGCAMGQHLGLSQEGVRPHGYLKGIDFLLEVESKLEKGESPRLEGGAVIVGGGNVAMDCCRTARRIISSGRVTVAYRRGRSAATADPEEIQDAIAEGVAFEFFTAPKCLVLEAGQVVGVELTRMAEGEPDASGRRRVSPVPGSEFIVPCRYVIGAVGQTLDQSAFSPGDGIELTRRGTIAVAEDFSTSREGVFAGGDAATGPATLIQAMADGEDAADSIANYLATGEHGFLPRRRLHQILTDGILLEVCNEPRSLFRRARHEARQLDAQKRVQGWDEVEMGMSEAEAREETKRCMRCYRLFAVATDRPITGLIRDGAKTAAHGFMPI